MYREADLYINLHNTTEELMSFCVHNHQCDHVISAKVGSTTSPEWTSRAGLNTQLKLFLNINDFYLLKVGLLQI